MIRNLLSVKLGEFRWTQADLDGKIDIRPNTISEKYTKTCDWISLEHLDLICEALDCELDEILIWRKNPTPKLKGKSRSKKN